MQAAELYQRAGLCVYRNIQTRSSTFVADGQKPRSAIEYEMPKLKSVASEKAKKRKKHQDLTKLVGKMQKCRPYFIDVSSKGPLSPWTPCMPANLQALLDEALAFHTV